MGLPDPHDKRLFTHFARVNDQGEVIAIIEIADTALKGAAHPDKDGSPDPVIDVTDLAKRADVDLSRLSLKQIDTAQKATRG